MCTVKLTVIIFYSLSEAKPNIIFFHLFQLSKTYYCTFASILTGLLNQMRLLILSCLLCTTLVLVALPPLSPLPMVHGHPEIPYPRSFPVLSVSFLIKPLFLFHGLSKIDCMATSTHIYESEIRRIFIQSFLLK